MEADIFASLFPKGIVSTRDVSSSSYLIPLFYEQDYAMHAYSSSLGKSG